MKRILLFLCVILLCSSCQATEEEKIVERTHLTNLSMWRYDFEYRSVDVDGTTPITLSGAIFLSDALHDKKQTAQGCILLNHYTITSDDERPSNVSSAQGLESVLQTSNNFVIESDGIGFGKTVDRPQCYLQGRAAARCNIDGFIAGRKLLAAEGYDVGQAVFNLGYSQGGHTGMWVNRLVAEGYRSDDLPKINYCILGGGPYDVYATYQQYLETDNTQYPVALQLIINEMATYTNFGLSLDTIFVSEFIPHIPELYDSKRYSSGQINDSVYTILGGSSAEGIAVSRIMKPIFFDEKSELMQHVAEWCKSNSLVYEKWYPSKTDSILLIHSTDDEIVPYLNTTHLDSFFKEQGYSHYKVNTQQGLSHGKAGTYYALYSLQMINQYKQLAPTGTETIRPAEATLSKKEAICAVYTIDGRLVRHNADPNRPLQGLDKGIYIVGGKKMIVR